MFPRPVLNVRPYVCLQPTCMLIYPLVDLLKDLILINLAWFTFIFVHEFIFDTVQ